MADYDCGSSVCITTNRIYDSCRDRDCIKDSRVYFSETAQEIVESGINVKIKKSEVIWVYSNVEEMPFNKGFYTVDIKYFIKVTLDIFSGLGVPNEVEGLVVFDKKVILFGSEGKTKSFVSKFDSSNSISEIWEKNNLPVATVQVASPVSLSARFEKGADACFAECCCIPESINNCFSSKLITSETEKNVLVSIGLFTVVKLERPVELRIENADFCIPQKECNKITKENPCEIFETICFPVDEFYPPTKKGGNGGSCCGN